MQRGTRGKNLWKIRLLASALLLPTAVFSSGPEDDLLFRIYRNLDIFGRVYKEIALNYVDQVDPDRFMEAGIDGMLGSLDPYTTYIGKEEGNEVDLLTNGKYGGIGVTVGVRDGTVRVITVMDGYSAQRQGIFPGDKLIQVDSVKVVSMKPDAVRNLTRGEPGTLVRVVIEREGELKPLEFVLVREEIQLKNVTYAEFVEEGIAYVRLERFSRKAGDELRQAIKELKLKGEIRGLVLDVRGNPGGLLDAAVEVVSKFVPRGSLIVSTRGRRPEADKKYASMEEPILPLAPLVVLTDRNSASASEIVSGSLQDMDRAVIAGTRTFGKGLVQTIVPLTYGAQLKITTARYYTPSGRSIQEIDYLHRDKTGVFGTLRDSLQRSFTTAHGRAVYEHGGVIPDSLVPEADVGPMVRGLVQKALLFKFVNQYVGRNRLDTVAAVTDRMLSAFREFLAAEKFEYEEEGESKIRELRRIAEQRHYSPEILDEYDHLAAVIQKEKKRGFDRYRDHIIDGLSVELMARLAGDKGRIEASLKSDLQLKAAIGILRNPLVYTKKLGI